MSSAFAFLFENPRIWGVVVLSALASAGLAAVPGRGRRAWLVAGAPLLIALVLYWWPEGSGPSDPQASAWMPVFVVPSYLLGLAAALFVSFLIGRCRRWWEYMHS